MLWLRKRLRKNSKRSGANMVSMKDIAQRCGVSVATVSKALTRIDSYQCNHTWYSYPKGGEIVEEVVPRNPKYTQGLPCF